MKICGMDEVGRGALAGPLMAAAVVLNSRQPVAGLKDSKLLNRNRREKLYREIIDSGAEVAVETISARQINNRGIGWANKEVFRRLIKRIEADRYLIDGPLKLGNIRGKVNRIKSMVGADRTRKCVMAASIIAKVTRDGLMRQLHEKHDKYGWDTNVGYGTKKHIEAIRQFGSNKHHRKVFVNTALSENFSLEKSL